MRRPPRSLARRYARALLELAGAGGRPKALALRDELRAFVPQLASDPRLGQALALLEHLHASGRRVGVISHVEELKERIPVKIEVTPTGRGTSEVRVVSG